MVVNIISTFEISKYSKGLNNSLIILKEWTLDISPKQEIELSIIIEIEYCLFISPVSSQNIFGWGSLFKILIIKETISISEPEVDKTFCDALFFLKIFSKLILSISVIFRIKLSINFL